MPVDERSDNKHKQPNGPHLPKLPKRLRRDPGQHLLLLLIHLLLLLPVRQPLTTIPNLIHRNKRQRLRFVLPNNYVNNTFCGGGCGLFCLFYDCGLL
jgi:hypothetical protein